MRKSIPRAQFETDKDANYTKQEDITLSVYNKINEEYKYDFNDTNALIKDKAKINNEIYESPKNERRGRDEMKVIRNKKSQRSQQRGTHPFTETRSQETLLLRLFTALIS